MTKKRRCIPVTTPSTDTTGTTTTARWTLRLYIADRSDTSVTALHNLKEVCAGLDGQIEIDVVDVREQPALVITDNIIAVPTLIKSLPEPVRRFVGDLSDHDRIWQGLHVAPSAAEQQGF
jgi:circadian clock protein KaiB